MSQAFTAAFEVKNSLNKNAWAFSISVLGSDASFYTSAFYFSFPSTTLNFGLKIDFTKNMCFLESLDHQVIPR